MGKALTSFFPVSSYYVSFSRLFASRFSLLLLASRFLLSLSLYLPLSLSFSLSLSLTLPLSLSLLLSVYCLDSILVILLLS